MPDQRAKTMSNIPANGQSPGVKPRVKSGSSQDITRDFYDISLTGNQKGLPLFTADYHMPTASTASLTTLPSHINNPKLRKPPSVNGLRYYNSNSGGIGGGQSGLNSSPNKSIPRQLPSSQIPGEVCDNNNNNIYNNNSIPKFPRCVSNASSLNSAHELRNSIPSQIDQSGPNRRLHRVVSHEVLSTPRNGGLRNVSGAPRTQGQGPQGQGPQGQGPEHTPELRRFRSFDRLAPQNAEPAGPRRGYKIPPLNIDHGYPNLRPMNSMNPSLISNHHNPAKISAYNDDDVVFDDGSLWNVPLSPLLYMKTQQNKPPTLAKSAHRVSSIRTPGFGAGSISSLANLGIEYLSPDAQSLTLAFREQPERAANNNNNKNNLIDNRQSLSSEGSSSSRSSAGSTLSMASTWSNYSSDNIHILNNSPTATTSAAITRPSSLPPKTKTEERKHLKQYEMMMQRAAQAAKLRQEQELSKRHDHQMLIKADEAIWRDYVLPEWEVAIGEREVREMWWRNVPVKLRGQVWMKCIGSNNAAKPDLGQEYKKCVETLTKRPEILFKKLSTKIENDLDNTLPECGLFHRPSSPLRDDLSQVVRAVVYYQNQHTLDQVGEEEEEEEYDDFDFNSENQNNNIIYYSEDIVAIVGVFLLYLSPIEAFTSAINLTQNPNRPFLYGIHRYRQLGYKPDGTTILRAPSDDDSGGLTIQYSTFLTHFSLRLPRLYNHFQTLSLAPGTYFSLIVKPLFLKHFPLDIAVHLWDILFFEGDSFLLRLTLTVLIHIESKLYADTKEGVLKILEEGNLGFENGDDLRVVELVRNSIKLM